jgi:hypothetical protein
MHLLRLALLSLLLVLCAGPGALHGQTEPSRSDQWDREKWAELTEGLDYSAPQYLEEEAEVAQSGPSRGWVTFFKILAVLGAIGIIAFIILQLQTGESLFGAKNRKLEKGPPIGLENIEENLPEADIPDFIRNALGVGNYKMAVRLHYLGLIQSLAKRSWISWERDKTDGDYLREMGGRPVFEAFRDATLVFERIWYGNRDLEEGAYRRIAAQFEELEQQIQKS